MTDPGWRALQDDLARAADAGVTTRFWLRDDDAVAVTPALERLVAVCEGATMPILLAVIPGDADPALASWLADSPGVEPCQHGWRHVNHAGAFGRACELGGLRSDEAVLAELARGRDRLRHLFGSRLTPVLVPPWNRIRPSLVSRLGPAGYAALSAFGRAAGNGIPALNCDLDLIDWRNGRRGRTPEDLCGQLRTLVAQARRDGGPIGLLTHHLAHDDAAWHFLELFFERVRDLPGVAFTSATDELRDRAGGRE